MKMTQEPVAQTAFIFNKAAVKDLLQYREVVG